MNERGWEELVDMIDQRFGIERHNRQTEPLPDNHELTRELDTIEFSKAGQNYKIERVTGPAVVDKKTFYHKVGTSEHTQYVYDPDEKSSKVYFYQQNAGEWQEISPETLLS